MDNLMDPETLRLIVELQTQEARSMLKGKQRLDETSDSQIAARMFEAELSALECFHSDMIMSRSMARAVLADANAIAAPSISGDSGLSEMDDEMVRKLTALYVGDEPVVAESSRHPQRRKSNPAELRTCVACTSEVPFFETIRCPCSHDYCRGCMTELFRMAVNDESLFPPRCCKQPIPLGLNQVFLPAELAKAYKAKELEYATSNRTYCHVPSCSVFVPSASVRNDTATCGVCQAETCVICKGKAHEGRDCPDDTSTQHVLSMATENGWQRCYSCRRVVDLTHGCNHITCRCGAEFCYVCGVKWKSCECAMWQEAHLLGRANDVVDRDEGGRNARGAAREDLVERETANLVVNCDRYGHVWDVRMDPRYCEQCWHYVNDFINECQNCRIRVCRRCRLNRL